MTRIFGKMDIFLDKTDINWHIFTVPKEQNHNEMNTLETKLVRLLPIILKEGNREGGEILHEA